MNPITALTQILNNQNIQVLHYYIIPTCIIYSRNVSDKVFYILGITGILIDNDYYK